MNDKELAAKLAISESMAKALRLGYRQASAGLLIAWHFATKRQIRELIGLYAHPDVAVLVGLAIAEDRKQKEELHERCESDTNHARRRNS